VRLLTLIVSALLVSSCGGSDTSTHGERTIVAAFYPLAWAAEQVASTGDVVVNLTPPGVEPHDIELTPGDVERVRDADLVLYLGKGFMPALEDAVRHALISIPAFEINEYEVPGSRL